MRTIHPLCLVALLACVPLLQGCPGSQLKAELVGVKKRIDGARENGAYLCAPRELASRAVASAAHGDG